MKRRLIPILLIVCGVLLLSAGLLRFRQELPVISALAGDTPVLIIDAGHGGEDGGAVSPTGQVESEVNLAVARRLDALMAFLGVKTVLLRSEDISLYEPDAKTLRQKKQSDLKSRVRTINAVRNGVLVSIHQNTYPSAKYRGAQVFFANEETSLAFARNTQESMRLVLNPENHRQAARIPDTVYLMRNVTCPAILAECGFLSNPDDDALLKTAAFRTKIAIALAGGYLQTYSDSI